MGVCLPRQSGSFFALRALRVLVSEFSLNFLVNVFGNANKSLPQRGRLIVNHYDVYYNVRPHRGRGTAVDGDAKLVLLRMVGGLLAIMTFTISWR